MKRLYLYGAAALLCGLAIAGCDSDGEDLLAPYAGERPLILLRVTQSFTPDVQWVGGRVAAVGVNRGTRAALDTTLVWLMTAGGNDIGSHVTVGQEIDEATILQHGGTPAERLEDNTEYTVWIAEREAFDAGLDTTRLDTFNFADTTFTTSLVLVGRQRGRVPVEMTITRDQSLLGEDFLIEWTPADTPFRRIAIRRGAASAGFTDLIWHVVQPDGTPDGITSPVVIGVPPEGTEEAVDWPGGFEPDIYTVWMATSEWNGSFGINPTGMAFLVLFSTNFE